MNDVTVYYCALSGVQVGPKATPVVLASDYKALAAENAALRERLAEANLNAEGTKRDWLRRRK